MAWRWTGHKSLLKPIMALLYWRIFTSFDLHGLGNIWLHMFDTAIFNSLRPSDTYMPQWTNDHRFRYWLVAWPAPCHYLNHCRNIVDWTLGNKLQWNFNQNIYILIKEYAFENVVRKLASILSQPQYINLIRYTQYDGMAPASICIIMHDGSRTLAPEAGTSDMDK